MSASSFAWIPETAVADWVISSPYIWPTLECIHFVSLCVLMGSLLVIDLRLIGLYRDRCASLVPGLIRLALAAFLVNLATGLLFFAGNTFKYVGNSAFNLKLMLIAVAGLNAVYFRLRLRDILDTRDVTPSSIAVGSLSLVLWSGVIVCGRMITFYAP